MIDAAAGPGRAEPADVTILVVDDDEAVRAVLLTVVERMGHIGLSAGDAVQALALLDGHRIDLILLDLHMPGAVDGEDLLYLLRDRGDEVPIIVVSGWVDDDSVAAHPDCVYAVVKKPVGVQALSDTIRQALSAS